MNAQSYDYFPLRIELDYSYSFGGLSPYFEALSNGQALASVCPECGQVNFPPRLICDSDQAQTDWLQLSGQGEIVELTQGFDADKQPSCFALVRMDGAQNLALGKILSPSAQPGSRVKLEIDNNCDDHPTKRTHFTVIE